MNEHKQTVLNGFKILYKWFLFLAAVLTSSFILYYGSPSSTLQSEQTQYAHSFPSISNNFIPVAKSIADPAVRLKLDLMPKQQRFDPEVVPDPVKLNPSEPEPVKTDPRSKQNSVKKDLDSGQNPVKRDPAERDADPAPDPITVLIFSYVQMKFQTNYKQLCNLKYDCIFSQDAFHKLYHWSNYSALLAFGDPGFARLMNVVGNPEIRRNPRQIWIARGMESSISRLNFRGESPFQKLFNYSAGLSPNATFQDSYFRVIERNDAKKTMPQIEREFNSLPKDKDFCWMVSQCTVYNTRFEMGSEIINRLPGKIHMWGSAARKCMPKVNKAKVIDHGATSKTKQCEIELSKCKFYFAFENSNCTDYVTEKFANALANYAIPIVNGWRETYEQRLPGSFIHVSDFDNIAQLAEYLKSLLVDKEKFFSYHKWRLKYDVLSEDKLMMYNLLSCRICEKLYKTREANRNSMTKVETISNLVGKFVSLQKCSSP